MSKIKGKRVLITGGASGIGRFVDGAMSQLNYVPADWTDFIYSTIGEAWGFLGCSLVLVMYLAIILRMLYLARFTYDKYGMLIIIGVMGMLLGVPICAIVYNELRAFVHRKDEENAALQAQVVEENEE